MGKAILLLTALITMLGCASRPGNISAIQSNETYSGWSCSELEREQARLVAKLTEVSALQQKAHNDDFVGVLILGVPTASVSGADMEEEIGGLKGELEALQRAAVRKGCGFEIAGDPTRR